MVTKKSFNELAEVALNRKEPDALRIKCLDSLANVITPETISLFIEVLCEKSNSENLRAETCDAIYDFFDNIHSIFKHLQVETLHNLEETLTSIINDTTDSQIVREEAASALEEILLVDRITFTGCTSLQGNVYKNFIVRIWHSFLNAISSLPSKITSR